MSDGAHVPPAAFEAVMALLALAADPKTFSARIKQLQAAVADVEAARQKLVTERQANDAAIAAEEERLSRIADTLASRGERLDKIEHHYQRQQRELVHRF